MKKSIFSSYRTGENRVTATILAVLQSLSLDRIDRILGALIEDSDFQLVHFQNQNARGGKGIPDGEIGSSCRLLLETKLIRNDLKSPQLKRHLDKLDSTGEKYRMVLALTPDDVAPDVIAEINDDRLLWNSFAALSQAIDEMLADDKYEKDVISERERFLLRQLQKMLYDERLVESSKDVLVIPARHAWSVYNELHAYICQEGRTFQSVKYIAFYAGNQIYPTVPFIREQHDHVVFERGANSGKLGELVNQVIDRNDRALWPYELSVQKVFLLSGPGDEETVKLKQPIINDMASSSGQRVAFTQNQRYVSMAFLQKASKTSELAE